MLPVASSSSKEYVGSGGKNANLAAILDGHGGQQNKQHNSENDKPMPLILFDHLMLPKLERVILIKTRPNSAFKSSRSLFNRRDV